uniref:Death domain-containing protein n=1 Tax=Amphimedon queenslandica TaxID=400682 RepID=A0A1X7TEM0_AMPQE
MATSQTCLGVDDLVDVLDLLKRCGFPKANWYDLGLRLGLKKSTLDVIEKNHPHDVSRCMTECLSQWLGRADNVDSRGGANLDSLSDALRSMNETAVAEKLKHHALIAIFNNHHTVLSQSLCDSVGIAGLLYAEQISVVDLTTGEVKPAQQIRGEEGWTVEELKQYIGELFNLNSSCMRLLRLLELDEARLVIHLEDVKSSLKEVLFKGDAFSSHKLHREQLVVPTIYVSSDSIDYQKEYEDSLMYRYVDLYFNSILLDITLPPPQPEATLSTTNVTEGRTIMKIISINYEEDKRKVQVQVDKRITLAQLKEKLVPLIGVPPTGFIMYGISRYGESEYEMMDLDEIILSGSKLIVRLGRPLEKGECRIKLYLLQVNNTDFCKYMMESIVAEGTRVREFKKQIIEEAKVQGIDCVLELDKMRLRNKNGVYPGRVYLNYQMIDASMEAYYVEPLKGPEKMYLKQVYVIRWRPSQCSVDPIEEIILDDIYMYDDLKHVIEKLSELSGVPAEYIYCAENGQFPVEMSCLDIENKLKWCSITSDTYSLELYNDGRVIYYKDNRERMKELTDKERSEILEAEEARLKKIREYKSQH